MRYLFVLLFGLIGQIVFAEQKERITPDSEMAAAMKHLATFPLEDQQYIRFFTTFAIPEKLVIKDEEVELRKQAELCLPFALNSVASYYSEGRIITPRRVPGSGTLWWIDIQDLGWKTNDIDEVFKFQPYFLAPLVSSENNVILFRADWFIVYSLDVTKLADRGFKDFPYYILLYGKGNEPKNADDFRKTWEVDIKTIRAQKVERGTIVDAGDSGVSRHTRQLRRGRTVFGYYWETRDVKSHDIDPDKVQVRDYVEDIFANFADAGEYIATHKNGLQVYLLTAGNNDNFKRVEFGDPTIVIDRQDAIDPRVRTAKSCITCHSMGIIPATNDIQEFFKLGGDLKVKYKDLYRQIAAFYLDNLNSLVEDDNKIFERAIKKCNGLTPEDNLKCFLNVYHWYDQKVTLEQAALECGMIVEDYKNEIKVTTSGRLARLYKGKAIPREIWDSINGGGYVQSMALIKRLNKPQDKYGKQVVTTMKTLLVDENNRVLQYLEQGSVATIVKVYDHEWYIVQVGGRKGYINRAHCRPRENP